MTLEDRKLCIQLVREASVAGARLEPAFEVLGKSLKTLICWEAASDTENQRKGPLTVPSHALSSEERNQMISVANSLENRELSPWHIVAKFADLGIYIASESFFYRVLKKEKMLTHRN